MTCGIYAITHKESGKMYIGQSIDIEKRWGHHVKYGKDNSYIDRAIAKHGEDKFILEVLYECSKQDLDNEERKFINLYGTYKNGYNLTLGGDYKGIGNPNYNPEVIKKKSGKNHPMYGKNLSEDKRKRISINESKSCNKTGFYRVSKQERKGYITYSYGYHENKQQKFISNKDILKLKTIVLKKGLDWFIIDEKNAKQTLIENKKYLTKSKHHKSNSTGFYKVCKHINSENKIGYQFEYAYLDGDVVKRLSSHDIFILKEKVLSNNLKWEITNKELANKTIAQNKQDFENAKLKPHGNVGKSNHYYNKTNSSGFYRVQLVLSSEMKIGYYFVYIYKVRGKSKRFYNKDIKKLEKRVKEENLEWKILDNEKAQYISLKNKEDLLKEVKGRKNKSGLYNVFITKRKNGFTYTYRYTNNKKRTNISSHSISDLKKKVLGKGLDWIVLDEEKAKANGLV